MTLTEILTKRIKDLCNDKGITPNKLSTLAGMPAGSLKSIFYGKSKNTGLRTILELCQAIDITLYDFFNIEEFRSIEIEGDY